MTTTRVFLISCVLEPTTDIFANVAEGMIALNAQKIQAIIVGTLMKYFLYYMEERMRYHFMARRAMKDIPKVQDSETKRYS